MKAVAPQHGGNLREQVARYGGALTDWLDLSTGVSPFAYPVGSLPAEVWQHLPQIDDGLEQAALRYYNAPFKPLAVAGSQAAIMALPSIILARLECSKAVVALPRVGYKEHQHAWQQCGGCELLFYDDFPSPQLVARSDVLVVIHPNNPSGERYSVQQLLELRQHLAARGGYLLVDEAFMDCTPQCSLLHPELDLSHLVVLRSVGKFFGLAGARVGFVFAELAMQVALAHRLGPWTVAGPCRWVVQQALLDKPWQQQTKRALGVASQRLNQLLAKYLNCRLAGSQLFTSAYLVQASDWHRQLCEAQIYTRLCDEGDALRFGLPASEADWTKLTKALQQLSHAIKETSDGESD
ncbi:MULTISPECIES: threonine-phosphate decarboxylase CobD [unclassified Agarivorans]|uniref:threonine-phosphate decarboxylase CobD n=1 Tax=unclassified Agarivorans TaxID=2636026 RepID=UPI003D7EF5E9